MLTFLAKRVLSGLVLIALIPSLAFVLMRAGSADVARQILGQTASEEQVAARAEALGLDRPLLTQYLDWAGNALRGDLGVSWFTNEPVSQAMATRVPATLSLVIVTTIVAAIIAVALGLAAAYYGGWLDNVLQVLSIVGFALPGFWLALMLVLWFAIDNPIFPATGYVSITDGIGGWARSITLPVTALAVGAVTATAQQVRGAVRDVLQQDWVRTLRARGISRGSLIFKHVLRSAGVAGLTVLGLQFIGLLGGAVFVERVFAIPGMGQVLVTSTSQGDLPLVLGVVLVTTVIVVIVNIVIDLGVGFFNPKARLS
ncbi:ABC transporter permease [Microbacterium sorbitolivorans]|uniref:ABC transporter permease n=1 Tax=Microbacterium sorbitolivorans TaxID=1867410 RepID=A0A367Y5T5_9MICO|nr:ABC transporter permease [Microbacterium sorbitolivorans]RCK61198.1 ABC transporter permease [Microbacterium sorbitolivorans]GGF34187.1 ABC transporter permease [Microbacterium sorbitolivorans]